MVCLNFSKSCLNALTLFTIGFFGAAHGWEWGWLFVPPSLNPTHISYNDEARQNYTLPKGDPKNV